MAGVWATPHPSWWVWWRVGVRVGACHLPLQTPPYKSQPFIPLGPQPPKTSKIITYMHPDKVKLAILNDESVSNTSGGILLPLIWIIRFFVSIMAWKSIGNDFQNLKSLAWLIPETRPWD
jgi:hypothetical protein